MIITRNKKINNFNNKSLKKIDWNKMISASSVRNFILNDTLVDWLKIYNINCINDKPNKLKPNYNNKIYNRSTTNFQFIQGNLFEEEVMKKIKKKFQVITIGESTDSRLENKYLDTIEAMKNGYEIIYQGVLHDYELYLYGCPDLLVRSDRINEIFNYNVYSDDEIKVPSKLNNNFHYVVVDIKCSTLKFASNGINLLNNGSSPAFKGQLNIYNRILNNIQGFELPYAFILGKRWSQTSTNMSGDNYMNILATIDYNNYDSKYNQIVDDAIDWLNLVKTRGHEWSLLPKPSINELYPNMKIKDNGYKLKKELDNNINEITSVWMCSFKKRQIAHSKKIYSWKNKKCNAKNLEFKKGTKQYKCLNEILKINRQNNNIMRLSDIKKNKKQLYFNKNTMEFYLDFETINGHCNIDDNNEYIYMIGVYHYDTYKCFYLEELDKEKEMFDNFWSYIDNICGNKKPMFIHWTNAEVSMYKRFCKRHNYNRELNTYDLHKVFLDNIIVINGALNFSLKTIVNALYEKKQIQSNWDDSLYSNGLDSMYGAINYYKNKDDNIMKEIIKYNKIDCKVLYEILQLLRNKCK